jgi:hypothetical protein
MKESLRKMKKTQKIYKKCLERKVSQKKRKKIFKLEITAVEFK